MKTKLTNRQLDQLESSMYDIDSFNRVDLDSLTDSITDAQSALSTVLRSIERRKSCPLSKRQRALLASAAKGLLALEAAALKVEDATAAFVDSVSDTLAAFDGGLDVAQ